MVETIRNVVVTINQAGTGVLLVEQNATMALSIAQHGYVLETGRVVLDKPAEALFADDDVRESTSGCTPARTGAVVPNQALPSQEAVVGVSADPVARLDDVHLSFAGVKAVNGVSFEVNPDELFAIIGPNGAGKTSLFNVLSGVYRPQQGSVELLGQNILGRRPATDSRDGPGPHLPEHRAVRAPHRPGQPDAGRHRNPLRLRGRHRVARPPPRPGAEHRRVVEEIVDFLELEQWRALPVGLLPYGVQKRVELGGRWRWSQAAAPRRARRRAEPRGDRGHRPLHPGHPRRLNIPIIMVEHDMGLVMDFADRVMVVDFGTPITTGPPEEVQRHPDVVRAYLGEEVAPMTSPGTRIRDHAAAMPERRGAARQGHGHLARVDLGVVLGARPAGRARLPRPRNHPR